MGKRELVALLNLSSWCLVVVEQLFLAVPRCCLQFVIVFPDHTHYFWNRNFVRPTGCVYVSVCESVCPFIFFPHISSGTRYRLINVFHGSCTLKSVELIFYLINILQFYNLNKYLSTRTNILLGSIHKLYNSIDVLFFYQKKVVKNDNFSSVSM